LASGYVVFKVEADRVIGYTFFNYAPIERYSPMIGVMYVGFAVVLSGLLWASRDKFGWLHKRT